jgi:tripartite ATP-independent transporter DctM subunit
MSPMIIALIIASSLLIALLTGLPVTFCLLGVSVFCFLIISGPASIAMASSALVGQISVEIYLAIPLFIFMAALMQESKVGYVIYDSMSQLMGSIRGGLAMGTIIATTLIAALSGIGATGTTMMGLVALPQMYRYKYHKGIVLGSIAAGGALGPLIPPSVLMIIVAGYADLSVGKLFLGGIIPGIMVTIFYCFYIGIRCYFSPQDGPPLPTEKLLPWKEKFKLLRNIIFPIFLAFFILFAIYSGISTPTEASSIGVLGALITMIYSKMFKWENIKNALTLSLKINGMVMWVLLGGGVYSTLITSTGTSSLVTNLFTSLSLGPTGSIMVMMIIPFIMGMFIDPVAIVMICVPIFMVVIKALGLDILWVMLLFIIVVIIGYISPPFGVNLFYMKGVAPAGTKMIDVYKGILPFVLINIVMLVLCIIFPEIVLYLPSFMD